MNMQKLSIDRALALGKTIMVEAAESVVTLFGGPRGLGSRAVEAYDELVGSGIFVFRNYFPKEKVVRLRKEVETLLVDCEERVWVDDKKSDRRLFEAEGKSDFVRAFLEDRYIQEVGKAYTRSKLRGQMSLAAEVSYVPGNRGSGGGWHRDSPVRRQFKSLLYLTDVEAENGPFEYLVGTHLKPTVLKLVGQGLQGFKQYRFTDREVEEILKVRGISKFQVTGQAGDLVLVDTKGIHRGAPLRSGKRCAVTSYFFPMKVPRHLLQVRN